MTEVKPTPYATNSHKSKEEAPERKAPEKVISGNAKQRKKSVGSKFVEAFAGDDAKSVGVYLAMEVMLPALKTLISDMASQGVERMLFGESRPRATSTRSTNYTSYNRMSSPTPRAEPRTMSQRGRATHDFNEVILDNRLEAERVIDQLVELVDTYGMATVSDLYALVGIKGSFVDDKWGWTDMREAGVRRVREGHLVILPRPESL